MTMIKRSQPVQSFHSSTICIISPACVYCVHIGILSLMYAHIHLLMGLIKAKQHCIAETNDGRATSAPHSTKSQDFQNRIVLQGQSQFVVLTSHKGHCLLLIHMLFPQELNNHYPLLIIPCIFQ